MYNSQKHHRHTIRLQGYDYSKSGLYFVTICTKDKQNIFGDIDQKQMRLSEHGTIAQNMLTKMLEKLNEYIAINEYVIMPNHMHLIIQIKKDFKVKLGNLITHYKSLVTKEINKTCIVDIWQRNYYEHIIRNEKELYLIKQYIKDNPINWEEDSLKKEYE